MQKRMFFIVSFIILSPWAEWGMGYAARGVGEEPLLFSSQELDKGQHPLDQDTVKTKRPKLDEETIFLKVYEELDREGEGVNRDSLFESIYEELKKKEGFVSPSEEGDEEPLEIPPEQIVAAGEQIKWDGDFVVERRQVVSGNVRVSGGDALIRGIVDGGITVWAGDIEIGPASVIEGKVHGFGGRILLSPQSRIRSRIWTLDLEGFTVTGNPRGEKLKLQLSRAREQVISYQTLNRFSWRYTKVEGFYFQIMRKWLSTPPLNINLLAEVGYGLAMGDYRYRFGAEYVGLLKQRLIIGFAHYRATRTEDEWMITTGENSLGALFLKEDYRDYYLSKGNELSLTYSWPSGPVTRLEYREENHEGMETKAEWALGGSDRAFRPNFMDFLVDSCVCKQIYFSQGFSYPRKPLWYRPRITLFVENEYAGMGGTFDYDRLVLGLQARLPFFKDFALTGRFRGGTTTGDSLPNQKRFYLGGPGSLRGHAIKAFSGDRMFLSNLEFSYNETRYLKGLLTFVLFLDIGATWSPVDSEDRKLANTFSNLYSDDISMNVGFGLGPRRLSWRLNIAQDPKADEISPVVTFRLKKGF
ncbi:BamA/TamA family outer membrane protein [candidate division KSB1 bacterium]|nr:BamA/TamA family outer membrane protein [candidate division KSB1 bacterium]